MATSRTISERTELTVLTPDSRGAACPGYQRSTVAQKNRETPPKPDSGRGAIPSLSPVNKSSRHRMVNNRSPNNLRINESPKSRNIKTLPIRRRVSFDSSKLSSRTLHIDRSPAHLAKAARRPAADYSAEGSSSDGSTTTMADRFPDPPAKTIDPPRFPAYSFQPQTIYDTPHLVGLGHVHSHKPVSNVLGSPQPHPEENRATLGNSTECISECIHSSPGYLSQKEYYFVHRGLDDIAKLERSIRKLQVNGDLPEQDQAHANEAQELLQRVIPKYRELTSLAPLKPSERVYDRSQLDAFVSAQMPHFKAASSDGCMHALFSPEFRQVVQTCKGCSNHELRSYSAEQEKLIDQQMQMLNKSLADRDQQLLDMRAEVEAAQTHEQEALTQLKRMTRAKDAKMQQFESQYRRSENMQTNLKYHCESLQSRLDTAETAREEVLKKLSYMEEHIKAVATEQIRQDQEIAKAPPRAKSYTDSSSSGSDFDTNVDIFPDGPKILKEKYGHNVLTYVYAVQLHHMFGDSVLSDALDGSTQAESSSDVKRLSESSTEQNEPSKLAATVQDDGNEADDESLSA